MTDSPSTQTVAETPGELREAFVRYCKAMQPMQGTRKELRDADNRRRKAEGDIVRIVCLQLGPPTDAEMGR